MTTAVAAASGAGARLQERASRLVGRPLFWLLFIVIGLLIPIVNQLRHAPPPKLPVLGTLPDFQLVDQEGRGYGSSDLRGHVWAADFIFTRCPTVCPTLTAKMSKIQRRSRGIDQAFRLISFTVDPEYDTPEVLAAYARAHKVSPRLWHLLTGSLDGLRSTVVDGLKVAMGTPAKGADLESVFHGTHFVLVDTRMRIRGYYDSSAEDMEDRLLHDAAMLINRGD